MLSVLIAGANSMNDILRLRLETIGNHGRSSRTMADSIAGILKLGVTGGFENCTANTSTSLEPIIRCVYDGIHIYFGNADFLN